MAKTKTFPVEIQIMPDLVKVTSDGIDLVNCSPTKIRSIIDLLATMIDDNIPQILTENSIKSDDFCISVKIRSVKEFDMILARDD